MFDEAILTRHVIARYGFSSWQEYLSATPVDDGAACDIPLLIMHARTDNIFNCKFLRVPLAMPTHNPNIIVVVSDGGAHVSRYDGGAQTGCWAARTISEFFVASRGDRGSLDDVGDEMIGERERSERSAATERRATTVCGGGGGRGPFPLGDEEPETRGTAACTAGPRTVSATKRVRRRRKRVRGVERVETVEGGEATQGANANDNDHEREFEQTTRDGTSASARSQNSEAAIRVTG